MAILLGKNLKIMKPVNDGYSPIIAGAKSCEIIVDGEQKEISSPGDGQWKNYLAGRNGWQVSVGYLLSAGTFPTEAAMVNTTVTLIVSDGTTMMQGSAIVKSWKATGNLENLSNGSFVFLGNGPLSPVTQE